MDVISYYGRTAMVSRWGEGMVCKIPWSTPIKDFELEFDQAIVDERRILEQLGRHPGIIQYQGPCNVEGMKAGLLLSEANCGDLQSFIENDDNKVNDTQRILWSFQLAQALGYVHTKGVLHWNISATNVLLHRTGQRIDAILADFGGSRCQELGIDGALLPDDPYLDPRLDSFDSPKTDIFSLGVIFYYIMTGHYPFHGRPAPQEEEKWLYGSRVQGLYKDGKFPDVSSILLGDVIAGCCYERRFETVEEVVVAIKANIGIGAAPVR